MPRATDHREAKVATTSDRALVEAFELGRSQWAGTKLGFQRLAQRVVLGEVRTEDSVARGPDLFLAWACAERDARAISYFERKFMPAVDGYVGRFGLAPSLVDEVRQELRIRLLVGDKPRIGRYSGRGPLAAWVRMAAIRVALNLLERNRVRHRERGVAALGILVRDQTSPELAAIRKRHAAAVRAGLERSLEALSERDKRLLRMNFIDRLNIEAMGRVFHVHRATVARWLVAVRRRMLETLRKELELDLRATTSDLRSMLTVMQEDLDLSIHRLLQPAAQSHRTASSVVIDTSR